ncbi:MAG TPA: carboxypeptidase-like regulatory domain-containing protein, partial [Pyrinomonadaceae bacterium]|nr:carboxypeptidase-like regulatory domain-containing protein [Pyrinomonadaceae bacterium]
MSRRTTGGSHVPARHVSTCHVRARLSAKRGLVVLCALFLFHASASIAARAQGGSGGATGAGRPGAGERGSASPGAQGSIKGRVVDDAGQPLAYAFVTLNTRASFPATPRSMQSTTDEEGNFNFDGLDAGAYHLVAHVAGYVPAREPGADSFADADTYRVGDTATLRLFKGSVITGTVTDADGAPVVAARMRVVRVRELDGTQARVFGYGREFLTDDRGVYRLYGLRPGAYLVVAGGPAQWTGGLPTSTDSDAPTYFPSGPRDTATEVTVRAGQEATGVDIRYRGERGFVVSGRVEGAGESSVVDGGMQLVISHAASGALLGSLWFPPREWEGGFAFDGIADGEYELRARRMTPGDAGGPGSASKPVRVQVRGADVEGVRVVLAPLAALKGRILLAPLAPAERERAACEGTALGVQESLVYARRDEPGEPSGVARMLATSRAEGTPTAEGDFFLRGLDPGRYRVS